MTGTTVRDVGGVGGVSAGDLDRLDQAIDAAFEPLRGRPEVDRAAAVLSNLADYGFVWVALALVGILALTQGSTHGISALGVMFALIAACMWAPPSSSWVTCWPMAAFTRAGPAR